MDITILLVSGATKIVRAEWYVPTQPTPLGDRVLAVARSVLATRAAGRTANDWRVSDETINRAIAYTAERHGPILVAEALRMLERDYVRERPDVRQACFPLVQAPGRPFVVVPVVLLPLVLARLPNTWAPARSPDAVGAFVLDLMDRLPRSPDATLYRRAYRLLEFVACADVTQPPPVDDTDAPTAIPVPVLTHMLLSEFVIGMILQHRTHICLAPSHIDDSARPLMAALRDTPFRIDVEEPDTQLHADVKN